MRIAIGSQKTGFPLKETVKKALLDAGYEVADLGQQTADADFPFIQMIKNVTDDVLAGRSDRGIVICGSGAGASLAASKVKGIYCVACESIFMAERIVAINNANIMAMGAYTVSLQNGAEMAVKYASSNWGDGFMAEQMPMLERTYAEIRALEAEN